MSKMLVAFFSASGTTKRIAEKLASAIDGDLYEIKPAVPYTPADLNWQNKQSRSSLEMKDPSSRPELENCQLDLAPYEKIFLGFPIWWYTAPTIVRTFLESCDFTGKTVILFATSGGSGLGKTVEDLASSCPGAKLVNGQLFHRTPSDQELRQWAENF